MKKMLLPFFILLFSRCELFETKVLQARIDPPPMIEVYQIKKKSIVENIPFLGIAESKQKTSLHFLISGKMASCYVKEGSKIKAGQTLCQLDTSSVDLEIERATQSVQSAKSALASNLLEKQKDLFESGVIGQAEYEQVRLQNETAKSVLNDTQALLEIAQRKKKEHYLIAPWSGNIVKLNVKEGNPVSPEIPILFLMDNGILNIKTEIHASYFKKIKKGTKAFINQISSSYQATELELVVSDTTVFVSPENQSFETVLSLVKPDNKNLLVPGIMVSGRIEYKDPQERLYVPIESLQFWRKGEGGQAYFVDKESKLRLKTFNTGEMIDEWVEILDENLEGEKIVQKQTPTLHEGMTVSF